MAARNRAFICIPLRLRSDPMIALLIVWQQQIAFIARA
jgi:hypothetical protein